jgi:antitoxin ParD1/3/4
VGKIACSRFQIECGACAILPRAFAIACPSVKRVRSFGIPETIDAVKQMAEYERSSFLLPTDLAQSVREAVDGERYLVESDVVIEALRDWEAKERVRAAKLERVRALVQDGLRSAIDPLSADEFERIKKEGRALLASRSYNAAE